MITYHEGSPHPREYAHFVSRHGLGRYLPDSSLFSEAVLLPYSLRSSVQNNPRGLGDLLVAYFGGHTGKEQVCIDAYIELLSRVLIKEYSSCMS